MEAYRRKTKSHWLVSFPQMTRNQYHAKLWEQKLIGIGMLIISVIFLWLCGPANEDCSAVLITAPLGLLLLFSEKIMIV